MKDDERKLFPWLVEDADQARATIKYEIKLAETRLQQLAIVDSGDTGDNKYATDCCINIIQLYGQLLLACSIDEPCIGNERISENDFSSCYYKIHELKLQLASVISLNHRVLAVQGLIFYYENLESLFLGNKPLKARHQTPGISRALHELMHASSPEIWLETVVDFAKDVGDNTSLHHAQLVRLNDNELLSIYAFFIQPDYVALINSLFVYKLNPERLYRQLTHPEKLISVKARLDMLHTFIEFIHQSVIQILCQRGIHAEKDYLFHGDEIPQGIGIEEEQEFQELIAVAVKKWRLTQLLYADENRTSGRIDEIFRAYKFWFNPDLLIDAVMSLKTELVDNNLCNDDDILQFSSQLRLLYQQISTNQCIDLYGYFANKDSCYLMRTLSASFEGGGIDAMPLLTGCDKLAIRQVYTGLDCVMNALRAELQHRHISTAPYARSNHSKAVIPGRRNLQAVKRILELYHNNTKESNLVLEQLFIEMERGPLVGELGNRTV